MGPLKQNITGSRAKGKCPSCKEEMRTKNAKAHFERYLLFDSSRNLYEEDSPQYKSELNPQKKSHTKYFIQNNFSLSNLPKLIPVPNEEKNQPTLSVWSKPVTSNNNEKNSSHDDPTESEAEDEPDLPLSEENMNTRERTPTPPILPFTLQPLQTSPSTSSPPPPPHPPNPPPPSNIEKNSFQISGNQDIDALASLLSDKLEQMSLYRKKIKEENWLENATENTLICWPCCHYLPTAQLPENLANILRRQPTWGKIDLDQEKKHINFSISRHEEKDLHKFAVKEMKAKGSKEELESRKKEASERVASNAYHCLKQGFSSREYELLNSRDFDRCRGAVANKNNG